MHGIYSVEVDALSLRHLIMKNEIRGHRITAEKQNVEVHAELFIPKGHTDEEQVKIMGLLHLARVFPHIPSQYDARR